MRWIVNNFWLKLLALMLSVSCWFYVKEVLKREKHELQSQDKVYSDTVIFKKIPVQLVLEGEPLEGYRIIKEKVTVRPEAIFVTGPKSLLDNVYYVRTTSISVTGFSKTFTKKVELVSFKDSLPLKNELVEVTIPIEKSQ
ncbi:MAG: YbbR-like domain-containing protein [Candidatus Omnitrophota bacterium]